MQKLETINTKQIVTESVETKKVITESVARRVVKESADPVFTSSIARGLVEEFGYDLDERIMPDGKGGMTPSAAQSIAQQSAPTAPECCTNVYLDYVCGKFDIIDYSVKYIKFDNDDYTYYRKVQKYIQILEDKFEPECNDDDYNADNED